MKCKSKPQRGEDKGILELKPEKFSFVRQAQPHFYKNHWMSWERERLGEQMQFLVNNLGTTRP